MPIYEATATFFLLDSRNNYNTTYKMISDNILETRKKKSFYKICIERVKKGNSREQKKQQPITGLLHIFLGCEMECVPLKANNGQTVEGKHE